MKNKRKEKPIHICKYLIFSHFEFYNENENVVPLKLRKIYKNDEIGLRTLDEDERLEILTFTGVNHFSWHMDVDVIQRAILPHLD